MAAGGAALDAAEKFKPPAEGQILKTLRRTHPRLLMDAETVGRLRKLIRQDALAARIFAEVRSDAKKILTQAPSKYEIPDGRRLLSVSRRVKDRVRTLGCAHLIAPDKRYVERAWAELAAAADFKDWNPRHFLDTAEMTHALALGYDWFFHEWTDSQRKILRTAIVEKGLKPALRVYTPRHSGWATNENNWNQVCNGGIGMGALALADVEGALAATILHHAIRSLPLAMGHYAPDGGGTEGVTYWDYGCRYNTIFLAGLNSALGTDFGLAAVEGFAQSGDYQLFMSGADRASFNFGDCSLRRMSTPQHFWLARQFRMPRYAWFRYSELARSTANAGVLDLLWYDAGAKGFDPATLPLEKHFRKARCASMRSSWTDPNALVVGLQAGRNERHGHRHVELGSFIFDALGVRWAEDLGTERQTYLSHRHSFKRWDFYRMRAEGQNTLVINPGKGPGQKVPALAPISRFESTRRHATAEIDLTEAYAEHATRVTRTVSMIDRRYLLISDEVSAEKPVDLWWFMHTLADVRVDRDGAGATLSRSGRSLRVEVAAPTGAKLAVMPARPLPASPDPDIQADNRDYRKLAIHLKRVKALKLTVKLTPQR